MKGTRIRTAEHFMPNHLQTELVENLIDTLEEKKNLVTEFPAGKGESRLKWVSGVAIDGHEFQG